MNRSDNADSEIASLPATFHPHADARPYEADPTSRFRVKFDARIEFTNGGHVDAVDFLLDIPGDRVTPARLAEMVVSSMNLLRAGTVIVRRMTVVPRGVHADD